ncbi:MAG: DUF3108 domain-containing protein [Dysgonamonadaceae bacterium]|jgi:hypothetical protein|nr:DUF3108 domain-containing protein [Dysgonamonadaceae bacterium]
MEQIINRDLVCQTCLVCQDFSRDLRICFVLLCSVFIVQANIAQSTVVAPFHDGEELCYDIHYKYGLVMLKAGSVRHSIDETNYEKQSAYKAVLNFKTTSFFDKIFKIRDTLNSYISIPELVPIYHNRSVNEGNYHCREELIVNEHGSTYSEMRSKQERNGKIRFDTILSVNNLAYDIVNIFTYVRTLNYRTMNQGDSYKLTVFMGSEKANILIRYEGQSAIEESKTVKYKALKFAIDIVADKAFDQAKNAMEAWISDDENRIPIKMVAKLKIGVAEAKLSSYKNIKNPFNAKIVIKNK